MAISIITNTASINAQVNLNKSQNSMSQAIERLSTGLRINSAKDDAAGFAISTQLTAQSRGYAQAARNANDALSLANTAGSNLDSITGALQRIRELAVQASNGTYNSDSRSKMNEESTALVAEVQRIATQANFNGVKLLDGSFTSKLFQVGADNGQRIQMEDISSVRTDTLGRTYTKSLSGDQDETSRTALDGSNLKINGTTIIAAVSGLYGRGSDSAYAAVNALNSSGVEGLTASTLGTEETVAAITTFSAIDAGGLVINDVALGAIAAGTSITTQAENVVAAINALTDTHGVTASNSGATITVTASDGRNITATFDTSVTNDATAANTGFTSGTTYHGDVSLTYRGYDSTDTLVIQGVGDTAKDVLGTGYVDDTAANSYAVSLENGGIDGLSLLTDTDAQKAILQIDSALDAINTIQAQLGAFQNRMDFVIDNADAAVENNEAANSQIKDADFAAETANMTKANIMVQAGTAVLAQANSMKQSVLQLLG